jgi:hypothetical protein
MIIYINPSMKLPKYLTRELKEVGPVGCCLMEVLWLWLQMVTRCSFL